MPSLFRRKSADLVEEAGADTGVSEPARQRKGYTPSKQERGLVTPKRPRGASHEAPPADRKEAARRLRDKERAARAEQRAAMMSGDERYLPARDRGQEKALVRNIVDARRTVGTIFFSFAFLLLILSMVKAVPQQYVLTANLVWLLLGIAVLVDSVVICRKVKKLVTERFPKSEVSVGGLYMYAVMRSLSYRRMRVPKPAVNIGDPV